MLSLILWPSGEDIQRLVATFRSVPWESHRIGSCGSGGTESGPKGREPYRCCTPPRGNHGLPLVYSVPKPYYRLPCGTGEAPQYLLGNRAESRSLRTLGIAGQGGSGGTLELLVDGHPDAANELYRHSCRPL